MGREPFTSTPESTMEQRRKATLQVQYSLLGAFIGAVVATSDLSFLILAGVAVLLTGLPYVTNRYWKTLHATLPLP